MLNLRLSKKRLLRGFQCEKSLYLTVHAPELEAAPTVDQQRIFDQGNQVGIEAQKEYPFGVLIDEAFNRTGHAIRRTAEAVDQGALAIFEATFEHEGLTARIDILTRPAPDAPWEIYEVKSTASLKTQHVEDAAVQLFIARGAGLNVGRVFVQHLNPETTAPALEELFLKIDVTKETEALLAELPARIQTLRQSLEKPDVPDIDIGPHCTKPYECPFYAHCWKKMPSPSVFDFPTMHTKGWDLYSQGVLRLDDPRVGPFEGLQAHRLQAVRDNLRWVDAAKVQEGLAEWKWPLVHLDFETISYALPKYPGTHPYEQVPFQFAINIQQSPGGPSERIDFLHDQDSDPRPSLLPVLAQALARGESIAAYYKSFEGQVLKSLAAYATGREKEILLSSIDKLVDPLPIIRDAIYDPLFAGSFSIKDVAPALLGKAASYEGMQVPDGSAAQRAFLELTDPTIAPRRKGELRAAMLAYCRKDTDLMQQLVDWLVTVQ